MGPPQSDLPIWETSESKSATPDEPSIRKSPDTPRYSALLSAHNAYFLCRRFDWLRARLLLQKQDKLSLLEEKLEQVDRLEVAPLYLGKSRSDRNTERISLLSEIDASVADYERTSRIHNFGPACPRDIESLNNWLERTGSLAREETAYLARSHELISLAPAGDSAMMQLETWVEDRFIRLFPSFQKVRTALTVNHWIKLTIGYKEPFSQHFEGS
ncbi:hypothetical protein N7516_005604 [Penicillium verrucosum]|uniref:uncharacterized protein n=1 Tax=Penicillium verrucosum TaxID=60171 RepID=UPI002545668A|nr:uncharacterized protein N7516_005604 [Penicillium verrucosum]KAJ5945436.1 hypothetical protein N7516_005604 [Penicillium verrucosum]